ncbi:hypothetical protein ACLB2K_006264 [Fragaria x ananassa]
MATSTYEFTIMANRSLALQEHPSIPPVRSRRGRGSIIYIPYGWGRENELSDSLPHPYRMYIMLPLPPLLLTGGMDGCSCNAKDLLAMIVDSNKIVCNVSGAPTPSGSPSWVDMVMNTVEAVAEVVEAVAHKVEEVADDIADELPEDGKLKSAFEAVEAIAKETAKDAHMVDELIENVEAAEDKVEDFFESAMHGAGDQKTKVDGRVGGEEGNNVEEKKIE